MFLKVLLLFLLSEGAFSAFHSSFQVLPIHPNTKNALLRYDLAGEKVGYVVESEPICGFMELLIEDWTNGNIFDQHFSSMTRAFYRQNKHANDFKTMERTFLDMIDVLRRDFKESAATLIGQYVYATDLKLSTGLLPFKLNVSTEFGLLMNDSFFKEATFYANSDEKFLVDRVTPENRTTIVKKLLRDKYMPTLLARAMLLNGKMRAIFSDLFEKGQFSGELLNEDSGVFMALKEMMGDEFNGSPLDVYGRRASQLVVASVIKSDVHSITIKTCTPGAIGEEMELLRVVHMGYFKENGAQFEFDHLPEYMAVRNGNLDTAKVVQLSDCRQIADIHVCELLHDQAVSCQLDIRKRDGCDFSTIDAKGEKFLYVRSLLETKVVATTATTSLYVYEPFGEFIPEIQLKKSIFALATPEKTGLQIWDTVIKSGNVAANFSVDYPQSHELLGDSYIHLHREDVMRMMSEDIATLYLIIAVMAVIALFALILLSAGLYYVYTHSKRFAVEAIHPALRTAK